MPRTLSPWIVPAVLAVSIGASTAAAQVAAPWTSVGSAGTVDEADLAARPARYAGSGSRLHGARVGPPQRRAHPLQRGGGGGSPRWPPSAMTARWLDRGDGQRVFLELKEYNLGTGLTTTLLTLDSDEFPAAPTFQFGSTNGCKPPFVTLNFAENAYFVDAVLSRFFQRVEPVDPPTTTTFFTLAEPDSSGPALGLIKVDQGGCIK